MHFEMRFSMHFMPHLFPGAHLEAVKHIVHAFLNGPLHALLHALHALFVPWCAPRGCQARRPYTSAWTSACTSACTSCHVCSLERTQRLSSTSPMQFCMHFNLLLLPAAHLEAVAHIVHALDDIPIAAYNGWRGRLRDLVKQVHPECSVIACQCNNIRSEREAPCLQASVYLQHFNISIR